MCIRDRVELSSDGLHLRCLLLWQGERADGIGSDDLKPLAEAGRCVGRAHCGHVHGGEGAGIERQPLREKKGEQRHEIVGGCGGLVGGVEEREGGKGDGGGQGEEREVGEGIERRGWPRRGGRWW